MHKNFVIPAEAGIQYSKTIRLVADPLDPGVRRVDDLTCESRAEPTF